MCQLIVILAQWVALVQMWNNILFITILIMRFIALKILIFMINKWIEKKCNFILGKIPKITLNLVKILHELGELL